MSNLTKSEFEKIKKKEETREIREKDFMEPDFRIPGSTYESGSLRGNDYVVRTKEGDFFTYVPPDGTNSSFYVSTYEISLSKSGKPCSRPGMQPVERVDFTHAKKLAKKLGGSLPTKRQWKRLCCWLVETRALNHDQVYVDSTTCGNYRNNYHGKKPFVSGPILTGAHPEWAFNSLDNLSGNTSCLLLDRKATHGCATAGGSYRDIGSEKPFGHVEQGTLPNIPYVGHGMRVVLDKKHCENLG